METRCRKENPRRSGRGSSSAFGVYATLLQVREHMAALRSLPAAARTAKLYLREHSSAASTRRSARVRAPARGRGPATLAHDLGAQPEGATRCSSVKGRRGQGAVVRALAQRIAPVG